MKSVAEKRLLKIDLLTVIGQSGALVAGVRITAQSGFPVGWNTASNTAGCDST
jgi:hypothetical protein